MHSGRLDQARCKKSPGLTGLRTDHYKHMFALAPFAWAVYFEAIEDFAVIEPLRVLFGSVLAIQLLKKDGAGLFSSLSKTRPIGMCESIYKDALRGQASLAARLIGPVLAQYGQFAVGIPSGGEAAAAAIQIMVSACGTNVVASTDCSNAFCLADPDLIVTALLELRDDVNDSERTNQAEVRSAIEWCLDELCFIRHDGGLVYSVVDGQLECFGIAVGEVQGGLASMTRFCVFAAIYILKPMRQRFPQVTPIAIADDACFVMDVPDARARAVLAAALRYYGELMHACHQKTNFNKLVILQHGAMLHEDVDAFARRDVAARLDDFPVGLSASARALRPQL